MPLFFVYLYAMQKPIILRIKPRPAPRPRLGKNGAYNPSWYTQYKKDIVKMILSHNIKKKDYAVLYVVLGLPYPKTVKGGESKRIEGYPHRGHSGDTDNYIKGVKDAIQQSGIIEDDCQIYSETCTKVYTRTTGYILFFLEEM